MSALCPDCEQPCAYCQEPHDDPEVVCDCCEPQDTPDWQTVQP